MPRKIKMKTPADDNSCHLQVITGMCPTVTISAQPWLTQPFNVLHHSGPHFGHQYGELWYYLYSLIIFLTAGTAAHLVSPSYPSFHHLFSTGNENFQAPGSHNQAVLAIYDDLGLLAKQEVIFMLGIK
jgi:hypothetical protein